ncbi:MAG: ATP-binding cassette domain-containing protein [Clostridiaceae bacterium]
MLEIKGLCKVFNENTVNEHRVFDNFNFKVNEGDFVAIIGSNGAGKSTLLNLVGGSLDGDSGSVIIDGREMINDPEYKRSKCIGRVYQSPSMGVSPNMTILENLSMADNKGKKFGLTFAIDKKREGCFKELLKKVNLGLEDKLHTKVGLLSGGQRQALTLLMAVMSNPKILLLDEHTAALDPKTSEKIMEITREIVKEKGITTLMVTHNLNHAISSGNRLIMMHGGKVVIDVQGEEKQSLDTDKLIGLFEKVHVKDGLSDRTLFS